MDSWRHPSRAMASWSLTSHPVSEADALALTAACRQGHQRVQRRLTSHFTLRHGLASVAGHRRLYMQSRQGNGGGHAFAALSVGSRRVVNNQNVI